MFGRNKSSQGASKTRDCSSKTNTNVEAGSEMGRKNSRASKSNKANKSSRG